MSIGTLKSEDKVTNNYEIIAKLSTIFNESLFKFVSLPRQNY